MKASCYARQRNRRGHSPQTPRGETPQGGKEPTGEPHPPTTPLPFGHRLHAPSQRTHAMGAALRTPTGRAAPDQAYSGTGSHHHGSGTGPGPAAQSGRSDNFQKNSETSKLQATRSSSPHHRGLASTSTATRSPATTISPAGSKALTDAAYDRQRANADRQRADAESQRADAEHQRTTLLTKQSSCARSSKWLLNMQRWPAFRASINCR